MGANDATTKSGTSRQQAVGKTVRLPDAGGLPPSATLRALKVTFEVFFLGYLFGIAAFSREFAHLHITVHGIPLFVGELTLLTLTILAAAIHLGRRWRPFDLDFVAWALLILLGVGAAFAGRGLLLGFGLAVLRDFALVYYGWFFFLTLAYLRQGGASARVLGALLIGAAVGSLAEAGRFVTSPSLTWGHAAPGFDGMLAWAAVVIALALPTVDTSFGRRAAAAAAVAVCTFSIYLTAYRTLVAVVAVSVTAMSIWAGFRGGSSARRFALLLWGWMALMAAVILVPRVAIQSPPQVVPVNGPLPIKTALGSISHRWTGQRFGASPTRLRRDIHEVPDEQSRGARPIPDPQDWKGSMSFRLGAWRNALVRIEASPWLGIGYGPQAILFSEDGCDTVPSPTSNCGTAHNTFLTLAMRMGVPCALLLCGALGSLLVRSARISTRSSQDSSGNLAPVAAATALLSFLVFGLTSLLFESPYLSSVVWVLAGVVAHGTTQSAPAEPRP